jgi:hypothetical protein
MILGHPHYSGFCAGVDLSLDGRELSLNYVDAHQGGTKHCARYVFSLDASPRGFAGDAHESDRDSDEVPSYVLSYIPGMLALGWSCQPHLAGITRSLVAGLLST